jgi:hypothetical protein
LSGLRGFCFCGHFPPPQRDGTQVTTGETSAATINALIVPLTVSPVRFDTSASFALSVGVSRTPTNSVQPPSVFFFAIVRILSPNGPKHKKRPAQNLQGEPLFLAYDYFVLDTKRSLQYNMNRQRPLNAVHHPESPIDFLPGRESAFLFDNQILPRYFAYRNVCAHFRLSCG